MKKLLLSMILLTGIFTFATAQGVDFGIKGGLNISTLSGDVENLDLKSGLHAGIFLNLNLNKKFAISPEILFSQQGADTDEGTLKMDYVNVPVLAKISFLKYLNLHFGPKFGILMSAKEDDNDVKSMFKSSDVGVVGGLGFDLPLGITGGARYNKSLENILDGEEMKMSNQYYQFYLGYRLF